MDQIVLVQISDIHLAEVPDNRDFSGNEGYWGHHRVLCTGLRLGLDHVYAQTNLPDDQPLWVVVSGDLTQRGHQDEFHAAHSFLQSHWVFDPDGLEVAGLDIPAHRLFLIPGNHDQWNGWQYSLWKAWKIRPPAYNPTLFPTALPQTPWRRVITGGGLMLELFGVDSNSGLAGKSTNLRAGGSYARSELRGLIRLLRQGDATGLPAGVRRRVRVLVSHHGLIANWNHHWLWYARPLDPTSQGLLQRLAFRRGIDVVLTGHYHDFFASPFGFAKGTKSATLNEIRAPTASQGKPANHKQGFLAHQVRLVGPPPAVEWSVWWYYWHNGQFIVGTRPIHQFTLT